MEIKILPCLLQVKEEYLWQIARTCINRKCTNLYWTINLDSLNNVLEKKRKKNVSVRAADREIYIVTLSAPKLQISNNKRIKKNRLAGENWFLEQCVTHTATTITPTQSFYRKQDSRWIVASKNHLRFSRILRGAEFDFKVKFFILSHAKPDVRLWK